MAHRVSGVRAVGWTFSPLYKMSKTAKPLKLLLLTTTHTGCEVASSPALSSRCRGSMRAAAAYTS